jgi:hypothetical protein
VTLNRAQRRQAERLDVKRDQVALKMSVWLKPENKDRLVTRGEFMAIMVEYDRQRSLLRRAWIGLLYSRPFKVLLTALGATMKDIPDPMVLESQPVDFKPEPKRRGFDVLGKAEPE